MRFFVEVAPIGKTETQTSCVEADSWQKALQAARDLRHEEGPISGFSIELVEDGCRAVDPMARLRYVVRRAPADAPLTAGGESKPSAAAATSDKDKTDATKKLGGKTIAFGSAGSAVVNPARTTGPIPTAQPRPGQSAARTTGPTPSAQHPARATGPTPSTQSAARTTGPTATSQSAARTTGPVARGTASDSVKTPSVPPVDETRVLHRRFEDATPASPITYREEVYALPAGVSEDDAEGLLLTQFGHVLRTVHKAPSGKFIHLAVFDVEFEGKPPAPPLATLVWKDWKGAEPVIAFPRRAGASQDAAEPVPPPRAQAVSVHPIVNAGAPAAPAPAATPAAAPAAPAGAAAPGGNATPPPGIAAIAEAIAKASQPPPATTPSTPPRPAPAGIAALGEALAQASQPPAPIPLANPIIPPNPAPQVAVPAPAEEPPAPKAAASAPRQPAAAPVAASPAAAPAPVAPATEEPATQEATPPVPLVAPTPGSAFPPQHASVRQRLASRPSSSSMRAARMRSDELIAVLFESMHDLHFARDSVEGAEFCLALLLEKLPSKGGIVHFYDMDKREFVIAAAWGANVDKLLLRRHPTSDPLLAMALRQRGSVLVNDAATNDSSFVERLELLGSAKRVLVTPVMSGNRCLGAIEIMNPLDGEPYTDEEGNAVQYMAEQLAEFVGSHGLVLDPARIQRGLDVAAAHT